MKAKKKQATQNTSKKQKATRRAGHETTMPEWCTIMYIVHCTYDVLVVDLGDSLIIKTYYLDLAISESLFIFKCISNDCGCQFILLSHVAMNRECGPRLVFC